MKNKKNNIFSMIYLLFSKYLLKNSWRAKSEFEALSRHMSGRLVPVYCPKNDYVIFAFQNYNFNKNMEI